VTLTMLIVALRCLADQPDLAAPQDLHWDLSRMPTRPASGAVLGSATSTPHLSASADR
jgi:hypothetical protein